MDQATFLKLQQRVKMAQIAMGNLWLGEGKRSGGVGVNTSDVEKARKQMAYRTQSALAPKKSMRPKARPAAGTTPRTSPRPKKSPWKNSQGGTTPSTSIRPKPRGK
jgi:hypothetical protein